MYVCFLSVYEHVYGIAFQVRESKRVYVCMCVFCLCMNMYVRSAREQVSICMYVCFLSVYEHVYGIAFQVRESK